MDRGIGRLVFGGLNRELKVAWQLGSVESPEIEGAEGRRSDPGCRLCSLHEKETGLRRYCPHLHSETGVHLPELWSRNDCHNVDGTRLVERGHLPKMQ